MKKLQARKLYNYINELYCKRVVGKKKNIEAFQRLEEFCKDKKRCFIIGNGPSLTKEDLDKLTGEVTFACNRIFNFYEMWQPTVYFCQDPTILENNLSVIEKYVCQYKLLNPHVKISGVTSCKETIFYYVNRKLYYDGYPPKMAENFLQGVYEGFSVTYAMIQMAVLLGFKEIYLLGVDFNYTIVNGRIDESSYPQGVCKTKGGGLPDLDYNLIAFQEAARYCNNSDIRIFNLTRNTKLDTFLVKKLEDVL